MTQDKNRLYIIIFLACLAGYVWIYWLLINTTRSTSSFEVCFIKHISNIPCPSCGSSRSVISIIQGNFREALRINPLGYIIAIIMIISPAWIIVDLVFKIKSFYNAFHLMELIFKKYLLSIPSILLLIINWIWNIYKGL